MLKTIKFILIQFVIGINILLSQQADVNILTKIDKDSIKVGEQINLEIKVESTNLENIIFPEKYDFSPFIIAEEFDLKIDDLQRIKSITKKFKLTIFDEGNFEIKSQEINTQDKILYSKKIPVEVNTVEVDTIKKDFRDIKLNNYTVETKKPTSIIFYSLGIILLSIIIIYFLFRKLVLSPLKIGRYYSNFEIAINSLEKLEIKKQYDRLDIKQYYSNMIDILKLFFEKDLLISAFDSTSNELMEKIILLKKSKKIKLTDETINTLRSVLKNIDLVKFAKLLPEKEALINDKKILKAVLIDTKKAIPNNIEKELQQKKQREREIQFIRNSKRKKFYIFSSIILTVALSLSVYIFIPEKFNKFLIFDKNKKILNSEWVNSSYTEFNLLLETPDALKRSKDSLNYVLYYPYENESFKLKLKMFNGNDSLDIQNIISKNFQDLEIKYKTDFEEEFITKSGDTGIKYYGTYLLEEENKKFNYSVIMFEKNKKLLCVNLIFEENDKNLEQVVNRIENSIDFKNG